MRRSTPGHLFQNTLRVKGYGARHSSAIHLREQLVDFAVEEARTEVEMPALEVLIGQVGAGAAADSVRAARRQLAEWADDERSAGSVCLRERM